MSTHRSGAGEGQGAGGGWNKAHGWHWWPSARTAGDWTVDEEGRGEEVWVESNADIDPTDGQGAGVPPGVGDRVEHEGWPWHMDIRRIRLAFITLSVLVIRPCRRRPGWYKDESGTAR